MTLSDKQDLVNSSVYAAAVLFYTTRDCQIGELVVNKCSESNKAKEREIALDINQLMDLERSNNERLENILGMQSIAVRPTREKGYAEKAAENLAY